MRRLTSSLGSAAAFFELIRPSTMVAVFGISTSSRAQLVAEIDALGTNLLTVTPGQSFTNQNASLPRQAPEMVGRIGPVLAASAIGDVNANIYRNDRIIWQRIQQHGMQADYSWARSASGYQQLYEWAIARVRG